MMQEEAIKKTTGPCVILAGAGTGKTHTIVEKVKYLISNKIYSPERIVCITFSNEAANSLKTRVASSMNLSGKEPIVKTFHAFSADLLRKYGSKIGIGSEFQILLPDEAMVVMHRNFGIQGHFCRKYISAIGTAKDLGIGIEELQKYLESELAKLSGIDIEKKLESLQFELQTLYLLKDKQTRERKNEIMKQIGKFNELVQLRKFIASWNGYEKIKIKKNYQDYSDLNVNALHLLKSYPEIARDFDYIIVDEFQDTNKLQLDLIIQLAYQGNITIVGDLNQSIYRFRGAYKENFSVFKKAFSVSDKDVFNLAKSFRSPNKVLRAAHKLILNNYENPEDCFFVENFHNREGQDIEVYELKNAREEARKVADIVEQEIKQGKEMGEICVMFRTHQQGRIIKQALEMKNIPYTSASKKSLLKDKSIKVVIDYLTILNKLKGKGKGGDNAWWDLFYNSNFSEQDLIKIGKFIRENRESDNLSVKILNGFDVKLSENGSMMFKIILDKIKMLISETNKEVPELIQRVYDVAGLKVMGESKEDLERITNLNKFYELAKNHSALYAPDLASFIHYLSILDNLGIEVDASEIDSSGVRLMTLHSTKGLEYKTVIITNMADKRFPIERWGPDSLIPVQLFPDFKALELNEEEIEVMTAEYEKSNQLLEERRLCYVAFTRAKERLILTFAEEYAGKHFWASKFLSEVDYRKNPDFSFSLDLEEKYVAPVLEIKTGLSFESALKSGDFESAIEAIVKKEIAEQDRKMTFSPSALLTFAECQKKYEYKYVYNMPEKQTVSWEAMLMGSFVHLILEEGVSKGFANEKEFLDLARERHLEEDWQSVELDGALAMIKVFYERNKNKFSKDSLTEQHLTADIGGFKFHGYADRIDIRPDGVEIIDYKTGKWNIAPRHRNWQLGFYALAAKEYGNVKKVTLEMLKQEKPLEFELDDKGNAWEANGRMEFNIKEVEDELVSTAKAIVNAYEKGFRACAIEDNCEFCNEYVYGL